MSTALEFDHVSKVYDSHYYRTLRDAVVAASGRLVGRRAESPLVERALEQVTFTIEEGESVALIGRNGAGKTTALKLATRILFPTSGVIRVRGRVSALIEVGTGLHPELTGRENVQLFGRILGFKPNEIAARFDEIVSFSGVERSLEIPVKYYSSGMQLRLGFSLAAHLEPDILMVDEAIAVGDAGFQYRCVERMREVVQSGRTLVFVSHDLGAVEAPRRPRDLARSGEGRRRRPTARGDPRLPRGGRVRTYIRPQSRGSPWPAHDPEDHAP